jgi:glycerate kinase
MRIVVASQEFKGTLTAREAAEAMAEGVRRAAPDTALEVVPMSDGGPGLVDVILASKGGRVMRTAVQNPLGRPVEAAWALLDDGTAVIESASAAGLILVASHERDPAVTSTFGVGQLVLSALGDNCGRIIVGVGGSATNDGGAGMAAALGARFLDAQGQELASGGLALAGLERIDASDLDPRLRDVEVVAATDVTNPLCGPEGASLVYGPQKGASREEALELDAALRHYADVVERDIGVRVVDTAGAGAAGGLGAGLIAFTGAHVRPGFDVLAEIIDLSDKLQGADLVITGEGRLDGQTAYGKAVIGVARMAAQSGVRVLVVPGALADGWETVLPYVDGVEPIVRSGATRVEAMEQPAEMLSITVERALRGWLRARSLS